MRTFIAITLNSEIKQELAKLQSALKQSQADVKWVNPENIHLTLKFLGEINDEQAAQVKETLDKIAPQFKPYEISISGIGAFPKLDHPRSVWVGIGNGKDQTKKIAQAIEDELSKLGFQKDDREFKSHLTIGRVRSPKNKQELKTKLQTLNFKPQTLNVQHITFYKSTLTREGPIYTALHKIQLRT